MTRRRRIAIAILAVAGAFAAYQIATSFIAYTGDAYVRSDLVAVAPEVTGRIISVQVADNQTVVRGDLLALIDPVPFQLDVDQQRAEMNEAKAQVAADQDNLTSVEASLTAANAAATYAHETQTRLAALASDQFAARADLQKADDEMRQTDAAVEAAGPQSRGRRRWLPCTRRWSNGHSQWRLVYPKAGGSGYAATGQAASGTVQAS